MLEEEWDMAKISFFGRLLLLLAFISGILFLAKNSVSIRNTVASTFGFPRKEVAGVKTSLESEVKENLNGYIENVESRALEVRVSDIIKPFLRMKKIGEDIQEIKDAGMKEINKIVK